MALARIVRLFNLKVTVLFLFSGNICSFTSISLVQKLVFNRKKLTEKQLIEGCLKGNAKCQRSLFECFKGKMMAICRRYACDLAEAEDMLQESFIKIFTHIGQYRFEGPLEGWIRRIVVNSALEVLRKRLIRFTDIDREAEELISPDMDAIAALSVEDLLKLICNLPDGYRVVFNLYVIEGYDHNEIAEMLGINPVTSRSQLLKAKRALQEQIKCIDRLPKIYAQ